MRSSWRFASPLLIWLAIVLMPHPVGLSHNAWHYLGLFAGVIVALVLEPLPPAAVGLVGVSTATMLGDCGSETGDVCESLYRRITPWSLHLRPVGAVKDYSPNAASNPQRSALGLAVGLSPSEGRPAMPFGMTALLIWVIITIILLRHSR